jgi:hypothetical protein
MSEIIFLIICLLFSVIGVVLSIELGYCLVSLQPKLASKSTDNGFTNYSMWLVMDTLLELLIVSSLILINYSYIIINNSVSWFLIIALISLIIKTSNMTFLHRGYKKVWIKKSYLIFSYITALSLGSIGIYLVTGKQFWQSIVGLTLLIAMILGLTLIGLSYFNRTSVLVKKIKLKQLLQILFVLWLVVIGFVYPVALQHYNSAIIGTSLSVMEAVILGGVIGYTISTIQQKKPQELYQYCFVIGILVTFLIGWNNRPYFISGKTTVAQILRLHAFHGSMSWLVWLVLLVMIMLLLEGLYIFGTLLIHALPNKLIKQTSK